MILFKYILFKHNTMKKTTLLACLAILLIPIAASAYSVRKGDSIYVPKGEVVQGNLYAAGSNLTIEGKVTGDVICVGQTVNITGEVAGDVICGAQSINVSGKIGGSLRAAGNSINLNGQVSRNAMVFGATVVTSASSTVGWDFLTYAGALDLRGAIGRDLSGGGSKANLAGPIGGNVKLDFGGKNKNDQPLTIAGTAKINGSLTYAATNNANIETGAAIKGQTVHNLPKVTASKTSLPNSGWLWGELIAIFSALIIGLVLISFWKEYILKITDLMLNKIGSSFGWGILALLLTPIIIIILLITIIGIPLSLILLALWLIALYVSKILVGILVGRSLLTNLWQKQKDSLILAMIIGTIISYIIFAIPFIGSFVALLAMLWGLGGIILALKK